MEDKLSQNNWYYPIFIDLRGKTVVVIGGGLVALRKIEALRKTTAHVKVIAPDIIDQILQDPEIETIRRNYTSGDLNGAFLAIAATDDEQTNMAVSRDADSCRIFCNVVDKPELCSFIVPSLVEKGPIKIAISTGGFSPTLSKKLRVDIGRFLGEEYAILALILGRIRSLVLAGGGDFQSRKRIFELLVNSELINAIRENDRNLAEEILAEALGEHIDLSEIMP